MATTDYDFRSTRNQIIEAALRKIGAAPLGQPISAEQLEQAVYSLNRIIKAWQADHIFLWTLKEYTLTVNSLNITYSLPTDPPFIDLDKAFYRDATLTDLPIEIISYRKYQDIYRKENIGFPKAITYDRDEDGGLLYVYPKPDQNYDIVLIYVAKLKDFDIASGNADFPVRYEQALIFALASDLSHDYGVPLNERKFLQDQADYYLKRAINSDKENGEFERVTSAFPKD